jgi:hypothetical protein
MNMLDRRNNLNDVLNVATARINLGMDSPIDLSALSSDVVLKQGQSGYFNCAALSSVNFHIATGDMQRYRLVWRRSDAALGSNVPNMGGLQVNNTAYTNRFFCQCQDYGGGSGGGGNGYASWMTPGGVLYCWDALEITVFTDTIHKWINFQGWMRTAGTNYTMYGNSRMLSTASAGDSLDTTTAWTSLGTWVTNSGTMTGRWTVTREL